MSGRVQSVSVVYTIMYAVVYAHQQPFGDYYVVETPFLDTIPLKRETFQVIQTTYEASDSQKNAY